MSAPAVVQVEDLDVYYGTSQILFGVALAVRKGETMALLGRNGAGKSTTMESDHGPGAGPPRQGHAGRPGGVGAEAAPHRPRRPRLRAGRPPDFPRTYRRG